MDPAIAFSELEVLLICGWRVRIGREPILRRFPACLSILGCERSTIISSGFSDDTLLQANCERCASARLLSEPPLGLLSYHVIKDDIMSYSAVSHRIMSCHECHLIGWQLVLYHMVP